MYVQDGMKNIKKIKQQKNNALDKEKIKITQKKLIIEG